MTVYDYMFDRSDRACLRSVLGKSLLLTFGAILAGYFLGPDSAIFRKSVYVFVLISLYSIVVSGFVPKVLRDRVFLLVSLFGCYMASTAFLRPHGVDVFFGEIRHHLLLLLFLVSVAYLHYKIEVSRFLQIVVVLSCVVLCCVSIYLWLPGNIFTRRLYSYGYIGVATLFMYGLGLGVISGVFWCASIENRWGKIVVGLCTSFILSVSFLTQSRGGMVALLFVLACLFIVKFRKTAWLLILVFLGGGVLAGTLYLHPSLMKPDSLMVRFDIWARLIDDMNGAWLLGSGVGNNDLWALLKGMASHPHSIYVATFYRGGLVGVFFLGLVILAVYRQLFRFPLNRNTVFLCSIFTYCLIFCLADLKDLFMKPSHIWIYFWLPIALVIGERLRLQGSTSERRLQGLAPS